MDYAQDETYPPGSHSRDSSASSTSSGDNGVLTPSPSSTPSKSAMNQSNPFFPASQGLQALGLTDNAAPVGEGSRRSNSSDGSIEVSHETSRQPSSSNSAGHEPIQAPLLPPSPPVPLNPPCDPPTADDWLSYRKPFTKIYREQGRTLKEAKNMMKQRYNFNAT